jgi:hypothetical protein
MNMFLNFREGVRTLKSIDPIEVIIRDLAKFIIKILFNIQLQSSVVLRAARPSGGKTSSL